MTKFADIEVDIDNLAKGLLDLIYIHPDKFALSYGCIPADIMYLFDKILTIKIPDNCIKNHYVIDGVYIRQQITHAVICSILEQACKDKTCLV
jgi:hypothetical protein